MPLYDSGADRVIIEEHGTGRLQVRLIGDDGDVTFQMSLATAEKLASGLPDAINKLREKLGIEE
jgi:hypothetical protein